MSLTLATICSGIGAPEVALHALGWRSLWASQYDPEHNYSQGPDFPSAVLAHRFSGLHNYGDFTKIPADAASPDVLIGGTPCQAFSVAGLRGGLADARGGLTLAFVSLVGVLRPRWVVWENVPGVLSSDGGTAFGSLLSGLGLLGYGWAYRVLDAQYFGLAQRRKRVFVVAHSGGDWRRAAAVLFEPEGVCWDSPPGREEGEGVAGALGASADGRGWRCGADEVAAGQAVSVDLQNVAECGDLAGTLDCSRPGRGGGQAVAIGLDGGACARSLNAHSGRFDYETESFVIAHTLRGEGHDASEDGTGRGSPLVYTGDPDVADPISASEGKTYSHEGANFRLHNCVDQRSGIRRLTPREMERLQGFPDDFTLIPTRLSAHVEDDYFRWLAINRPDLTMAEARRQSKDGPRAKALGNSMAVPVLQWIGRRIELVDQC